MRTRAQLWGVAFLVLTLVALPVAAQVRPSGVDAGSFEVAQHGHPVGSASFRFATTPTGYASTSVVKVALQGLDYALSKTEHLSPAGQLRHALISAVVNAFVAIALFPFLDRFRKPS